MTTLFLVRNYFELVQLNRIHIGMEYWFWAIENGFIRVAESLLRRRRPGNVLLVPDIDVVDNNSNTAIHCAATFGELIFIYFWLCSFIVDNPAMITWLAKKGANLEKRGKGGSTPLIMAAGRYFQL